MVNKVININYNKILMNIIGMQLISIYNIRSKNNYIDFQNIRKYEYVLSCHVLLIIFSIFLLLSFLSWNQFIDAKSDKIKNIDQIHPSGIAASYHHINENIKENYVSCNCVVFRLDDVQDYWLNAVQNQIMDIFLNRNQTLSAGLIMHLVGNDSKILQKVKEGIHKGLFELDIHGWNHIDYTTLSEKEQSASLYHANEKMDELFGKNSSIFIPPLSVFNIDTIKAMSNLKFNILSSDYPTETKFDQNKSIFIDKEIVHNDLYDGSKIKNKSKIYHIPGTIFFKDFQHGQWIKTPITEIIKNVFENIAKYGYAVIVLHPQDFATITRNIDASTVTYINSINSSEISDLVKIMDNLSSNNIRIKGFEQIIKE